MIVIGIDPDSDKHGVAIYENNKLTSLSMMTIVDFFDLLQFTWSGEKLYSNIIISIEDVCASNAVFVKPKLSYSGKDLAEVKARSRKLGKCQQSQIELEELFQWYGIKVIKHKISKAWKKDKDLFEKITGWKGRSNEDTRSAAYFGYLGLNKSLNT